MSGYRGNSSHMVEGDHEVDPSMSRRIAHLSVVLLVLAAVVALAWFGLARFNRPAADYLSAHPGAVWALWALLLSCLWAYLAGQEFGRRDEAVRTSAWRTARAARAESSPIRTDCRECAGMRTETLGLEAEITTLRAEIEGLRGPSPAPVTGPEPPATSNSPAAETVPPVLKQDSEQLEIVQLIDVFEVIKSPGEHTTRETP